MSYISKGWVSMVDTTSMEETTVASIINRRRRQLLVHSVIYYKLNENLISDDQWSKWGVELEELQKQYPKISAECIYSEAFKDFDHSSGMNLPLEDPWAVRKARYLLDLAREKQSVL